MKKLFAIAILAAVLVACNNSSDTSTTSDTTTTVTPDTTTTVTPDTTLHTDTTKVDTSAKK